MWCDCVAAVGCGLALYGRLGVRWRWAVAVVSVSCVILSAAHLRSYVLGRIPLDLPASLELGHGESLRAAFRP
jgi:hypothetical protein